MIRTLFKHELLRTWRPFALVTLAVTLVVATFSGAAMLLPAPLNVLFAVLAVFAAAGYIVAVPLLISLDFYRSTYSKTGYFTAAIPAAGSTIFTVKAAYAYLATLLALAIGFLLQIPANIATGATSGVAPRETLAMLGRALEAIGELPAWLLAVFVVTVLLYPLVMITPFFFAATVGSEAWINRSGFGGVVLTWFLYYVATQILGVLSLFIPPSLDLRRFPDIELLWDPMAIFKIGDNAPVLPVAVFVVLFGVAIVAIGWAKVSYSRRLELR
ncbi:hypothetical protein SAMN02745244_00808 [Tessaracoccus bendigoensis DSM 12906]|uniref:ABC-2 type transport system permease protein n=1 Tax=Tessaracoccus bendigoensis DSM 12906 TaxID=1123357 RepID=A0A1M6D152_9ACTN|nr:hypothetical protein [Tessaracoccus bendigoensis]SHI66940.1 hypothetical protein SAMN02745244_00808 [Tessaracoccus bendigoensis DSM 12906]